LKKKKKVYPTSELLRQVLEDKSLAVQYAQLKSASKLGRQEPGAKKVLTAIEMELLVLWDKTKSHVRLLEKRAVSTSSGINLAVDNVEYVKKKNVLTIIKKLQGKFNLSLK